VRLASGASLADPPPQRTLAVQPNMTISGQELLRPASPVSATRPLLSVVVPTKNERGNVATLVERLEAALPTVAIEIVFVDDSTDGTAELVEEIGSRTAHDVVLLRQSTARTATRGASAGRERWRRVRPRRRPGCCSRAASGTCPTR
jgi:hypothetical protein